MQPAAFILLLSLVESSIATALTRPAARALPSGHPVLDNNDLPDSNYTVKTNVWPTGFAIPTETLTALPSGYSVGPEAVYGPSGTVVSFSPAEISQVALKSSAEAKAVSISILLVMPISVALLAIGV